MEKADRYNNNNQYIYKYKYNIRIRINERKEMVFGNYIKLLY